MYSFDVFDTLITRKVAEPKGIFALMQNILCRDEIYSDVPERLRENFYELRINAEELARVSNSAKGVDEVTLDEIYLALGTSGNFKADVLKRLSDLEYQMELENVVGIPKNIERLKELLHKGERVVLISDMYLSVEQIRGLLVACDSIFHDITLYVSSEVKRRKVNANLYWVVCESENVSCDDWIHIGNDSFQDIYIPQSIGIKTEHYEPYALLDFENAFIEKNNDSVMFQLSIGVSRLLRKGQKDYDMGCSIAGPILLSYAKWIVRECMEKNIRRLYFIARDGYILKALVDCIIRENAMDISTKYIYGSRKAWRMPSLSTEEFNLVEMIKWSYPERIRTVEDFAKTLQVSAEDLRKYLPEACNKERELLTEQEIQCLTGMLEENISFKKWYLQQMSPKKELLSSYLKQEIDCSDDEFAFVDLSGGGITQGCLKKVMKAFYDKPIQTFFFKTDRVNLVEDSICNTYLPNYIQNNLVIEMLARASHGQTVGYKESEEYIQPILFDTDENTESFQLYYEGVMNYAYQMIKLSVRNFLEKDNVGFVMAYYKNLAICPDKEVLEYFSGIISDATGKSDDKVEYAPRLSREDIRKIFLLRTTEPLCDFYQGSNLEYSILRCTEAEKQYIKECQEKYYEEDAVKERCAYNATKEESKKRYGLAYFYPIHLLRKHIILYGAGKMGKQLYERIMDYGGIEVVDWVDANVWKDEDAVHPVETIYEVEYDQIVLAIWDKKIRLEVEEKLMQMGVKKNKILNPCLYHTDNPRIFWWDK